MPPERAGRRCAEASGAPSRRGRQVAVTVAAALAAALALGPVVGPGPLGRDGGDASAWAVGVAGCRPGALVASLDLRTGHADTSPVGAVLLRHPSVGRCALTGAPAVAVTDAAGRRLEVLDEPGRTGGRGSGGRRGPGVTLGRGGTAAVSLTWSDWTCPAGSYELWLRFDGWSRPLEVPSAGGPGSPGPPGAPAGPPACRPRPVVLYVGAPVPVAARVADRLGSSLVR
ncbi:MAG: hypothetical protein ACYCU7_14175 [Acidimicrobiales bacterium]